MTIAVRRPDPASNASRATSWTVPPPVMLVVVAAAMAAMAVLIPASAWAEPASPRKIDEVVDLLKHNPDATPADLARAGSDVERVLVDLLSSHKIDEDLRFLAARALGGYRTPKARAVLASLVPNREEPSALRALAMRSLARVAGVKAIDDLLPWLKDGDPVMRAGAARALGIAGDGRACGRLSDALEHEEVLEVRVAIEDGMQACATRRNP